VRQLAGILFEMRAADADTPRAAVGQVDFQPAVDRDR
jgi:hypothetical protein